MILGVGCDITDIRRVERLVKKYKNEFVERLFTKNEIKLAGALENYSYFAKRFAAKEAYAKATGHGIRGEIGFKIIEVLNDKKRAPFFYKHPLIKQGIKTFLSISDEFPYTMAYVILEKN